MSADKSPLFTGFHSVFEAHERDETIILGDYSDFLCDHHWHWEVGGNSCCICNRFECGEKL